MGLRKLIRRYRHRYRAKDLGPLSRHWYVGKSLVNVGRFTYGDDGLKIRQWGEGAALRIGSFCSFADGITVMLGGNHAMQTVTTYPFGHLHKQHFQHQPFVSERGTKGDVVIGHDVWIGTGATILSGLTIGNGAIVGAMAVVSVDVPPYSVVVGNPARVVSQRFDQEIVDILQELEWWMLPIEIIAEIVPILKAPACATKLRHVVSRLRPDSLPSPTAPTDPAP